MKLFKSQQAQDDLIELWAVIVSDNEAAADGFLIRSKQSCSSCPILRNWAWRGTMSGPAFAC
jgi:hypothetical protein